MLDLNEAQRRILACVKPLRTEMANLSKAFGRFAVEDVRSAVDLPGFDNSAMDGYAVRASDVACASPQTPIRLDQIGRVAAGEKSSHQVSPGSCVRIFTGSPLPAGADAVVMQEDTVVAGDNPEVISITDSVKAWENIRFRGEDVKAGATIIKAGEQVTAGRLSVLASVGIAQISVSKKPKIGLLATGNELTEPGCPLAPGAIYESNRTTLAALCQMCGVEPLVLPIVSDTKEATKNALKAAFTECDAVISTGGVSVGELDFVKSAFEELGGRLDFWRVNIKPGKPFVFGQLGTQLFFGLPGNPVSAFVTFILLVRPALLRMQHAESVGLNAMRGLLAEPLTNQGDRPHFVRVAVDDQGSVRSAGFQASHIVSGLAHANGLVEVAPRQTISTGTMCTVLRWD